MKKVDHIELNKISEILGKVAKEKGLTKAFLGQEVERVRSELSKNGYVKRKSKRTTRY